MATESPIHIIATNSGMKGGVTTMTENMRSSASAVINGTSGQDNVTQELGILLRNHSRLDAMVKRKDSVPNRSGSAPPTVDGSLAAMGNLFSLSIDAGNNVASSGYDVIDPEQELRSDPAYLAYYYSHINMNPRLPPPIVSQKNYFLAHQLANGALMDGKKLDNDENRSLFSAPPTLPTHKEDMESLEDEKLPSNLLRHASDNWMEREPDGPSGLLHGLRPKSLVDLIQQDFPRTPSPVYTQIRSSSRLANEEGIDGASGVDPVMPTAAVSEFNTSLSRASTTLNSHIPTHNPSGGHAIGKFSSGSLSKLPELIARNTSTQPLSMGDGIMDDFSGLKGPPNSGISHRRGLSLVDDINAAGASKLAATLQGLNFSSTDSQESLGLSLDPQRLQNVTHQEPHSKMLQYTHQHSQHSRPSQGQSQSAHYEAFSHTRQCEQQFSGLEQSSMTQGKQHSFLSQSQSNGGASNNLYAAAAMSRMSGNPYYPNLQAPNMYGSQYGMAGYLMASTDNSAKFSSPAAYENTASGIAGRSLASGLDMHQLYKSISQGGTLSHSRLSDPVYLHYLQQQQAIDDGHSSLSTSPHSRLSDPVYLHYMQQQHVVDDVHGSITTTDPTSLREYLAATHIDRLESQKSKQSALFSYPSEYKSHLTRGGSHGMQVVNKIGSVNPKYYDGSPLFANSATSTPDSLRLSSRGGVAGVYVGWQGQRAGDIPGELKCSSLLEELKNSKTRRFELGDIAGHVVEFSVDQHGSRFIQQKLEVSSAEGKNLVFEEVLPRALTLMTDVFGNYVIQKFFEHGSPEQRSELANQLMGHVLELSLQMYGCRVIQKALEVVGVDQQVCIVSELNGHVMRCVRDQNGNHVIQKCIECVPTEHIQFIISACYGQVVMLSTHPYGCRVVQRVLEHCTDEEKQNSIVEDILRSTCDLAQDQYGNYVVQHVLEHGKPYEKAEIMKKLAGQIVQMSQHKFASNVVEKCLEFGGANERQILISEMLGHTDENEPLQAMMKDQYANYVVQKVLETCDDQQRELLLSRIKVHLHALKKYTYGKHIVARVEKLVAAGERRSAQVSI